MRHLPLIIKNNMSILFIIGGVLSFVYGTLTVLGFTNNDISKDSDMDKKLLSKDTRYFVGRYYSGFGLMGTGVAAALLGWILYVS